MRILYILILLIAVIFFCLSLKAEKDNRIKGSLAILQIKNEKLIPILDSIISHEQQCVYYTPELHFSIHSRRVNDTIIEFQIEAFGLLIEPADYNKGCFEHNGHWFFVTGQELNESIFIKTNQRKKFLFHKDHYYKSDGQLVLVLIEDDTYSMWIYHYIACNFVLKEMYAPYCYSIDNVEKTKIDTKIIQQAVSKY